MGISIPWGRARQGGPARQEEGAVTHPTGGLDLVFPAACEAADFGTAEVHLSHAMEDRTTGTL